MRDLNVQNRVREWSLKQFLIGRAESLEEVVLGSPHIGYWSPSSLKRNEHIAENGEEGRRE